MLYIAIYPNLTVSLLCRKPETIVRGHKHFSPQNYPIATVFAENEAELNSAIKSTLRELRCQKWQRLMSSDYKPEAHK